LLLFAWASCVDPGRVTPRPKGASGVEDVVRCLDSCDGFSEAVSFERLCLTTWVVKGLRTKYDKRAETCIDEFDHFCDFMYAPVGRGNHRVFVCHCCAQTLVLWVGWYMCFSWLLELLTVQREANPEVSFSKHLGTTLDSHPLLSFLLLLYTGAFLFVFALTGYQITGVLFNLTTNERINKKRYAHFWKTVEMPNGDTRLSFTNPFDKGSLWLNVVDFWWTGTRGQKSLKQATSFRVVALDFFFGKESWSMWWNRARLWLQTRKRSFDHVP